MRFEILHSGLFGRWDVIAVDTIHRPGLWGPCFTHHRPGNNHPRFAADTSTAGVLRFLATEDHAAVRDFTVTTNHFDADALLPVWALLHPAEALERRALLESVARCGDFFLALDERSLRIVLAIETIHWRLRGAGAPGERTAELELTRRAFEAALPGLDRLLDRPDDSSALWSERLRQVDRDRAELRTAGRVVELWDRHSSLVETDRTLDVYALNSECLNDLLIVWRTDTACRSIAIRPALGWYDLPSLPHQPRYELSLLARSLNAAEAAAGGKRGWMYQAGPASLEADDSKLSQRQVLDAVAAWLEAEPAARVPAAYRRDVMQVHRGLATPVAWNSHRRFEGCAEVSFAPDAGYRGLHRLATDDAATGHRFAVSDDFYWNERALQPLELELDFRDLVAGTLVVEHESWSDVRQASAAVELRGDGLRRRERFLLADPRLAAGQAGADLGLLVQPQGALELCNLVLRRPT